MILRDTNFRLRRNAQEECQISPLLYQQEVHRHVCQQQECGAVYSQSDSIRTEVVVIESKRAENGSAGNFNIETILLVHESELGNFIDDEPFETVMEYRKLDICQRRNQNGRKGRLTACSHKTAGWIVS